MSEEETGESDPVQAVVMRLVVELTVDDSYAVCKESDDKSERDWFHDDLLGDPQLLLHSNLVGDTIGTIKVVGVESA